MKGFDPGVGIPCNLAMTMKPPLTENSGQICDECGKFGAVEFDGETLCVDCYAERGSSCSPAGDEETED